MNQDTLAALMDPKAQELRAKYENARVAVAEGYRHAVEVLKIIPPMANPQEAYIALSRNITKAINQDLDRLMSMLDAKETSETKSAPVH